MGITGAGSLKAWERLESGSGSVFSRKLPGFKQMVGGASLMGGEGRVFGTLIGALIIAVIENGMNLLGVESCTQKVVVGCVILGAVALDRLKRSGGH